MMAEITSKPNDRDQIAEVIDSEFGGNQIIATKQLQVFFEDIVQLLNLVVNPDLQSNMELHGRMESISSSLLTRISNARSDLNELNEEIRSYQTTANSNLVRIQALEKNVRDLIEVIASVVQSVDMNTNSIKKLYERINEVDEQWRSNPAFH
jgi:chromosome segregation ATPase